MFVLVKLIKKSEGLQDCDCIIYNGGKISEI